MRRLLTYFIRGLVFLAPVAITVYVCVIAFKAIDGWLGIPIPGVGFVVTILLITLFGFLGSNLITRGALTVFDQLLERLPFVKFLYTSSKDIVGAVVGDKKRFDKPVLVRLQEESTARTLGFVTQETMERLGMPGFVAVYLPFSYSVAGRVYLFPAGEVQPLDTSSAEVMTFVVSGGVTEVPSLTVRAPLPPSA